MWRANTGSLGLELDQRLAREYEIQLETPLKAK